MSIPKYDRYHLSHKCSSIDLRLQELRDAGFDCDITRSVIVQHKEIKEHFTKEKCDQILTDTFTICYDFERKSPIAVYTEVTAKTVNLLNIDPRPPFFTDKRLDKKVATTTKDYTGTGYDR